MKNRELARKLEPRLLLIVSSTIAYVYTIIYLVSAGMIAFDVFQLQDEDAAAFFRRDQTLYLILLFYSAELAFPPALILRDFAKKSGSFFSIRGDGSFWTKFMVWVIMSFLFPILLLWIGITVRLAGEERRLFIQAFTEWLSICSGMLLFAFVLSLVCVAFILYYRKWAMLHGMSKQ